MTEKKMIDSELSKKYNIIFYAMTMNHRCIASSHMILIIIESLLQPNIQVNINPTGLELVNVYTCIYSSCIIICFYKRM